MSNLKPLGFDEFYAAANKQIEVLEKSLGGIGECQRLGFIFTDGQGVMSLSTAGLGYLLSVEARGITSLAEAFAAGYKCAHDEKADS